MDHSICATVSNYAGFYSTPCVSNSHRAVAYIVFLLTTGVLFSASEVTTLSRYTNTFIIIIIISVLIGCEDRLRNDLYCVEWGVKLYSIHLLLVLLF